MKFGLFYEISIPRPWTPETERTVYNNCLEQVKLADELGFDQVWAVEHHFLEEYSHCSAPELFLTACAVLTKRIQVGHGIVVCVPEFNHPIKIAERTATLDILSGGRLHVGTGRSATWTELGGFGANPDTTKKSWDEFVRCLPKMWMQETFSYQGEFWSMPERTILPKPYQKPHPPMWVAVTSPGTEIDAAERGLGSLGLSFAGFDEQEKKIKEYRRRIQSCEPVGAFVNEQVATTNFLFCHEDEKTGVEMGKKLGNTFNYLATQLISTREVFSSPSYQSLGLLPALRRAATGPDANEQQTEGMAYGDPARIIRAVKKWESLGVDCINFILNANEVVPQDQVMASLKLFAKEVMPVFAKKPAQRRARRRSSDMPLYGTLDLTTVAKTLPTLANLDTEAWTLPKAEMLQLLIEVPRSSTDGLLPKAMHPALPVLRDPGRHQIFREPGRPVHARHAAARHPGRRPSARLDAGRGREQRRGRQGAARPLGLSDRGGRREIPAPARPGHGHGEEGRQDHPRLRAGRPAAGVGHRRAVHQLGDGGERAARRPDPDDADPGRSEIHLLQGRARQAAGRRRSTPRRGTRPTCSSPIRSSAPAAPSTPTCRASAS